MVASIAAQEQLAILMAKAMPREVLNFKFDTNTQERIFHLTQQKKENALSFSESEELEKYLIYDLLIGLAKARAFQNLNIES